MRPDGPYNRCGSPALYPGQGRSGQPPVWPAVAAPFRQRHRAVVSGAAGGRGAVQGRAARDHLAGGRRRRHAHCPDHCVFGLAVAGCRPGARRRHRPARRGLRLLPFPVPQLRARRRGSWRRAPGGHARQAHGRRGAGSACGGVGAAVRSGYSGRADRRCVADRALAGSPRAAICPGGCGGGGRGRGAGGGRGAAGAHRSRRARPAGAVSDDLRDGLLARLVWPQVTLASVLVVAGHSAVFVIAARTVGCTAPLGELVALLLVVQTAVVIPLSIGGWGLREGAAAWAFAAAGLGAATGVTVAILYAVLMLIAVAPGAGLLLGDAVRRRRGGQLGRAETTPSDAAHAEAVRG